MNDIYVVGSYGEVGHFDGETWALSADGRACGCRAVSETTAPDLFGMIRILF